MTQSPEIPDGILLVAKPGGMTSHDVVAVIRKFVHPKKVGHTGTLDPMATGLLPLTIGEATKLTRFLSSPPKRYRATLSLGVATDTLDHQGEIVSRVPVPSLSADRVRASLEKFVGEIEQIPPMYSALHHQGRRMYDLARAGIQVERKARKVQIHQIELLNLSAERIEFDVSCGSGTYIRSLAADIAIDLGTQGHLSALQRTETGGWNIEQAQELTKLDKSVIAESILSLEQVLSRFAKIAISQESFQKLTMGQQLSSQELGQLLPTTEGSPPDLVWFCSARKKPIVLAEIQFPAPGLEPTMKILRQLRPEKQSTKK